MKFAIGAAFAALTSFAASSALADISDPVKTASGRVSGVTLKSRAFAYLKEIPFALLPVGPLRWKEPQLPELWSGVRKADKFGNICMQQSAPKRIPVNTAVDLPDSPGMSEDLWTAASRASARLDVHGLDL